MPLGGTCLRVRDWNECSSVPAGIEGGRAGIEQWLRQLPSAHLCANVLQKVRLSLVLQNSERTSLLNLGFLVT